MEEYKIGDSDSMSDFTILQGHYYQKIHSKHIESYGDFGATNIRDNITSTFRESMIQFNDPTKNNNMLLVGKVQSGKTSNLELYTALAFDNGFNFVIIYGGYDNTLLSQTTNRFKKTFDIPNDIDYSDETPVVFSSDDSDQLLTVDNEIIEDLLDANKPIFLISMKRPAAMNKVNDLLGRIDKRNIKAFIIDDEGALQISKFDCEGNIRSNLPNERSLIRSIIFICHSNASSLNILRRIQQIKTRFNQTYRTW